MSKRFGQIIGVSPGQFERYRTYKNAVWEEVLNALKAYNIKEYTIFCRGGYLYAYFEYTGNDFCADISKMASDQITAEWWKLLKPMQQPMVTEKKEEWWTNMEIIFNLD